MNRIYQLMLVLLLGSAIAFAQAPAQSTPDQSSTPDRSSTPGSQASPSPSSPDATPTAQSPSTGDASQANPNMSSSDVKSGIQSALQQDASLSGVSVSVTDSAITLSGSTNSQADKDKAQKIASANAGTRQVVNNVKVSGSTSSSPQ